MSWTFSNDPETYAGQVLPLLTARPVDNTLPLTVLEGARAGRPSGTGKSLFGWYQRADGEVAGAVSMDPPYGLLLAELPADSVAELVGALRRDQVPIPDVAGPPASVAEFVQQWTDETALRAETVMRQQLYQLTELRLPARQPAGSARPAVESELDLVLDWLAGFYRESEHRPISPSRAIYRHRVGLGLLWFWCRESGEPVALSGRNVEVAGVSRIGPVYTPPPMRQHGYGTAATHACTRDALERGAQQVLLFTDLANPTSNGIYQSLGYRPIDQRVLVRFH